MKSLDREFLLSKVPTKCIIIWFCNQEDESQEHLETVCTEVSHERRGLDLEKVTGKVSFWLRMERKFAATVALAARHLDTDSGD